MAAIEASFAKYATAEGAAAKASASSMNRHHFSSCRLDWLDRSVEVRTWRGVVANKNLRTAPLLQTPTFPLSETFDAFTWKFGCIVSSHYLRSAETRHKEAIARLTIFEWAEPHGRSSF